MRFLAPLSLVLVFFAVACCGNPPKHILPIGDDPEVVFEVQLITASPDPRRAPPPKPDEPGKSDKKDERRPALARKGPRAFK